MTDDEKKAAYLRRKVRTLEKAGPGAAMAAAAAAGMLRRLEAKMAAERETKGLKEELDEIARQRIEEALIYCYGNKTQAAKRLGLNSQQTLTYWMKRLGMD